MSVDLLATNSSLAWNLDPTVMGIRKEHGVELLTKWIEKVNQFQGSSREGLFFFFQY